MYRNKRYSRQKALMFLSLIALGLAYFGCSKKTFDDFGCITTDISYSLDIEPVFQANCLGCHNGPSASSSVDLSTHELLSAYADTVAFAGSALVCIVEQTSPDCASAYMPPAGGPINPCSIEKIKAWVAAGAPNN